MPVHSHPGAVWTLVIVALTTFAVGLAHAEPRLSPPHVSRAGTADGDIAGAVLDSSTGSPSPVAKFASCGQRRRGGDYHRRIRPLRGAQPAERRLHGGHPLPGVSCGRPGT